jgi:hypothetical protein
MAIDDEEHVGMLVKEGMQQRVARPGLQEAFGNPAGLIVLRQTVSPRGAAVK